MNTQKLPGVKALNKGRAQAVIQATLQLFLHRAPRSAMPTSGAACGQQGGERKVGPHLLGPASGRLLGKFQPISRFTEMKCDL